MAQPISQDLCQKCFSPQVICYSLGPVHCHFKEACREMKGRKNSCGSSDIWEYWHVIGMENPPSSPLRSKRIYWCLCTQKMSLILPKYKKTLTSISLWCGRFIERKWSVVVFLQFMQIKLYFTRWTLGTIRETLWRGAIWSLSMIYSDYL